MIIRMIIEINIKDYVSKERLKEVLNKHLPLSVYKNDIFKELDLIE